MLPPYVRTISPARPGLVHPVRVDAKGQEGPTRRQVRSRQWRRVTRGRYVPSTTGDDLEQRIANAADVLPHDDGGVTGWAALRWYGATWFDGLAPDGRTVLPVDLATGPYDVRSQAGIVVCAEHMGPWDFREVDGIRLTTPSRSLLFVVRHAASLIEAVVALDMACQADVVSLREASAYAAKLRTWTGIPQARTALGLADENSWSPWETRLRMTWVLRAQMPTPLCNRPVFDLTGRHLGTPDLLDPVAGVVGEYDGGVHLSGPQRRRDVARESDFRRVGLACFSVVAGDLQQLDVVEHRIKDTYARALWQPQGAREWTITPPPWWRGADSVDARRARRRFGNS